VPHSDRHWRRLVGCAVVVKSRGGSDEGTPGPTVWEKMQEKMEEMPMDFPPRVMFDNIAAIREDTDRILELLDKGGVGESADSDAK